MRHVADSSFSGTVGGRRSSSIWPIRSHRGGENDAAFDAKLDEFPGCRGGAEVCTINIQLEQIIELRSSTVKRWLMLRHACIGNHFVDGTLFCDDGVDGIRDGSLFGDVALHIVQYWDYASEELGTLDQVRRDLENR